MAKRKEARLSVLKTYKLYIGGQFPRTESGRYFKSVSKQGELVSNICLASRKDVRNAIVIARKAQCGWAGRTAFNRGQILYRMAEMLESRSASFVDALVKVAGYKADAAQREVEVAIDRLVHYAGWSDKLPQALGTVNPVAAPFFNYTTPDATGVVGVVAPKNAPLLSLVSAIAPVIVAGNSYVVVVESDAPSISIDFAEVLATSDLPGGVVNILTGKRDELLVHLASHMDVDMIAAYGVTQEQHTLIDTELAEHVGRVKILGDPTAAEWQHDDYQGLYRILPFLEFKTIWHPVGV